MLVIIENVSIYLSDKYIYIPTYCAKHVISPFKYNSKESGSMFFKSFHVSTIHGYVF